jgi:hypothetical protein
MAGAAPPQSRTAAIEPDTPATGHDGQQLPAAGQGSRVVGWACIVLCGLLALYGIYLAIPNLHKLWS